MVLTSLGDLWIFESKECRRSYNLLLLIPWFDEILYHSMLELCDFLMIYIYKCVYFYIYGILWINWYMMFLNIHVGECFVKLF